MEMLAPLGPVYQAGTLSGNPLGMAAGIATLTALQEPDFYIKLNQKCTEFYTELATIIKPYPLTLNFFGSMFTLFCTSNPVRNYAEAKQADTRRYAAIQQALLASGFYFAPSQFEANFISAAHSKRQLAQALTALRENLRFLH